jgi:hypothetical protein
MNYVTPIDYWYLAIACKDNIVPWVDSLQPGVLLRLMMNLIALSVAC